MPKPPSVSLLRGKVLYVLKKSLNFFIFVILNYFACHSIHLRLCVGLWMYWTGLLEEEALDEDEEPEAQDIQDPTMDLTREERGSLKDTVAVTEREQ